MFEWLENTSVAIWVGESLWAYPFMLSLHVIGLAIVGIAGHAQTSALHDAAHDTRHAAGFPCH